MSPALCILAMEGFTHLLKVNSQLPSFKYHRRCDNMKLSFLAFAGDLFIQSRADEASIKTIKDTLNNFSDLTKCEVFVTGTTNTKKHTLANILGMPLGSLP